MKKMIAMILAAVMATTLAGCYDKVEAGNVGVKVQLLGSDKGVDNEVLGPGRYWIGMNEDLFIFPTSQQNYTWTSSKTEGKAEDESMTFQTADGLSVRANLGVTYRVDPAKVPLMFQRYRKGLDEVTAGPLRNAVRDELNRQGARDSIQNLMGGDGKSRLLRSVQDSVAAQFAPLGIVDFRLYLASELGYPEAIIQAITAKIAATQKAQQAANELAAAEAEGKKMVASAEAEARANELKQRTLTPQLIEMARIEKWDGHYPQVMGANTPMLQLK